jgi:hypothetical protein
MNLWAIIVPCESGGYFLYSKAGTFWGRSRMDVITHLLRSEPALK